MNIKSIAKPLEKISKEVLTDSKYGTKYITSVTRPNIELLIKERKNNEAIFPSEARTTIGEMTQSIYLDLAKLKNISFTEAVLNISKKEFEQYIDDMPYQQVIELMYDTNGYGRVYVNYMRNQPANKNKLYLDRIKKLLKYGGVYLFEISSISLLGKLN